MPHLIRRIKRVLTDETFLLGMESSERDWIDVPALQITEWLPTYLEVDLRERIDLELDRRQSLNRLAMEAMIKDAEQAARDLRNYTTIDDVFSED